MLTLSTLKAELKTDIEARIQELTKRHQTKGSFVISALEEIDKIIQQPTPEAINEFIHHAEHIKTAINKLSFLAEVPESVKTWHIFEKHLANLQLLLKAKHEQLSLESAQEQLKQQNTLREEQKKLIENSVSHILDSMINAAYQSCIEKKQQQEALALQNKMSNLFKPLQQDDETNYRHAIAVRLQTYAGTLRRSDIWPACLSELSLKAYKAKQLETLADTVNDHFESSPQELISHALKDRKLIQGFFKHRTRDLLQSILHETQNESIKLK